MLPTPVFWSGEFHGLYGPRVRKSRTRLSDFHFHFHRNYLGWSMPYLERLKPLSYVCWASKTSDGPTKQPVNNSTLETSTGQIIIRNSQQLNDDRTHWAKAFKEHRSVHQALPSPHKQQGIHALPFAACPAPVPLGRHGSRFPFVQRSPQQHSPSIPYPQRSLVHPITLPCLKKGKVLATQSCLTLGNPTDCRVRGFCPLSMGLSRQEY